ncbi:exonuclease domain-containing protein [Salinibacterium sp. SYSU T00001]|uniref:exonuclease domain-containing protein n=1 Tax=Homoserinimonas sedimenticola TaxID=2986805 RepID=UPI00223677A3|nr:exonuclease domain-containing protein [Salinibacterium sedimenticola]MCW4384425.1 exonuclease domain-containing protein [Salinibacterium sedimenticola]
MVSSWVDVLGVFDLETTGIDVDTSRIVSAHVGLIDGGGASVEQHLWLADPGIEIPAQASAVHGITTDRARTLGRPAREVVAEILSSLRRLLDRGIPITVFNAPYDLTLLDREARRHGLEPIADPFPIVDPLVIDKAVDRYRRGKRTLEVSAQHYGVTLSDAHDAGADAIAAGRVAQAIVRRFAGELPADAASLHAAQVTWHAQQAESFQDYMRRTKDPSFVTSTAWPVR